MRKLCGHANQRGGTCRNPVRANLSACHIHVRSFEEETNLGNASLIARRTTDVPKVAAEASNRSRASEADNHRHWDRDISMHRSVTVPTLPFICRVLTRNDSHLTTSERKSIRKIMSEDCFPRNVLSDESLFPHEFEDNFRSFMLSDHAGTVHSYLSLQSGQHRHGIYHLWNVCTGIGARRRGYFRALLQYAQEQSEDWKEIKLEVLSSNKTAIAAYREAGFVAKAGFAAGKRISIMSLKRSTT